MRIQGAGSAGSVKGELNVSGSTRWPLGRRRAHLIKICGRRVVRHARMITFELAGVAIFCDLSPHPFSPAVGLLTTLNSCFGVRDCARSTSPSWGAARIVETPG
jgi:hypothetical protein